MNNYRGWLIRSSFNGACLALFLLSSSSFEAQSQRELDLASVPSRKSILLDESPVRTSDQTPGRYKLPLKSTIQLVYPTSKLGSFILEVLIRNTSSETILVPSSVDPGQHAVSIGNTGRRQMNWSVVFHSPATNKFESQIVTVSDGAITDRGTLTELRPQESMLVRLPFQTPATVESWARDGAVLEIQVMCEEWMLEDGRNVIKGSSQQVVSENRYPLPKQ